jgi:hypothetical protein
MFTYREMCTRLKKYHCFSSLWVFSSISYRQNNKYWKKRKKRERSILQYNKAIGGSQNMRKCTAFSKLYVPTYLPSASLIHWNRVPLQTFLQFYGGKIVFTLFMRVRHLSYSELVESRSQLQILFLQDQFQCYSRIYSQISWDVSSLKVFSLKYCTNFLAPHAFYMFRPSLSCWFY